MQPRSNSDLDGPHVQEITTEPVKAEDGDLKGAVEELRKKQIVSCVKSLEPRVILACNRQKTLQIVVFQTFGEFIDPDAADGVTTCPYGDPV